MITATTTEINVIALENQLERDYLSSVNPYREINVELISDYGSSRHYRVTEGRRVLGTFFRHMGKKEWYANSFYKNGAVVDCDVPLEEKSFSNSKKAQAYLIRCYLA